MATVIQSRFVRPNPANRLQIPLVRRPVHRLEFEDLHFGTDREVFLPAAGGLDAIAVALAFAARSAGRRALVAGHTDSTGSAQHNRALSRRRAEGIWFLLRGLESEWAEHAHANAEVADWQEVFRWAHVEFQWDTNPGEVDGAWGPLTASARDRFRTAANAEFGLALTPGNQARAEDWRAVFRLYDLALEARLDLAPGHLGAVRAKLEGWDEPLLACGEDWPVEKVGLDGYASEANRRVDIFFFDAGDETRLGDDPATRLYRGRHFDLFPIPADVTEHRLTGVEVFLLDPHGERMAGAPWEMRIDEVIVASGTAGADGKARALLPDRPPTVLIVWGSSEARMWYRSTHVLALADDAMKAAEQRLANLGFQFFASLERNVAHAETCLGLEARGDLEALLPVLDRWHEAGEWPDEDLEQSADGLAQLAFLDELDHIGDDHEVEDHEVEDHAVEEHEAEELEEVPA